VKLCCEFRPPKGSKRIAGLFSWIAPGAVLALMPKCPACLAAYIALGTGIGVSVPVADNLRLAVLALSFAVLGGLAIRVMARYLKRPFFQS
jgi:hypothetical protein